ncbi:MAG: alkaline phosphatase [Clostridiales bacterium]|nr:alkaline phosphatase [Clostridiales bacterium]
MKKFAKSIAAITIAIALAAAAVYTGNSVPKAAGSVETAAAEGTEVSSEENIPKYIFLFIGDGMSYPQIQLTNYFISANSLASEGKTVTVEDEERAVIESKNNLTMMNFDVAGSAQTYDSTSFAPDSSSTATAIATGHKTWSGSLNVSLNFSEEYETIAEKLKAQKDCKVGIISSVNVNHATPAAFYAHQPSRNSYYDIGLELIDSGFDFFAGGAFLQPTGPDEDQTDIYSLAEKAGYKVVKTQAEAEKVTAEDGKTIIIDEHLSDHDTLEYEIDRQKGDWALADYVEKGIEVLDNDDTGFFMMVEGGKIDWACHANDAASVIRDTVALDNAVDKAVEFYNEHPDETLIIVTGDHETGGLSIGFAGTDFDTFLTNFNNQKISFIKYDEDYVTGYKENNTDFDTVMSDITRLFGLEAPEGTVSSTSQKDSTDLRPESENSGTLVMTDYEYDQLKEAYEVTLSRTGEEMEFEQEEYELYGSYEPLSVTITHILNHKSGVNFGSYAHTGLPTEVLVKGVGAENFAGYYDNTDIFKKLAALTGVK